MMMACGDLVPSKAKIKFEALEGEIVRRNMTVTLHSTADYNRFCLISTAHYVVKSWEYL